MTLLDVKAGAVGEVGAIRGGKCLIERLNSFGLHVGVKIKLVKTAPFRGPLLIENMENGARIMVGRKLAGKIEVRNGQKPAG